MSDERRVSTGQDGDPAQLYVMRYIADACNRADRIRRAKDDLDSQPKLSAPPEYVAARNTSESLRRNCLLTPSNEAAFIAAVAASRAAYEAIP